VRTLLAAFVLLALAVPLLLVTNVSAQSTLVVTTPPLVIRGPGEGGQVPGILSTSVKPKGPGAPLVVKTPPLIAH
jgi:hypothetical protein